MHFTAPFKENLLDAVTADGDEVQGPSGAEIIRREGSLAGRIRNGERSAEAGIQTAADIMFEDPHP